MHDYDRDQKCSMGVNIPDYDFLASNPTNTYSNHNNKGVSTEKQGGGDTTCRLRIFNQIY